MEVATAEMIEDGIEIGLIEDVIPIAMTTDRRGEIETSSRVGLTAEGEVVPLAAA